MFPKFSEVFFIMVKVSYPSEIKWAVVKAKLAGEMTNKEIMERYEIKNVSQIKTWMRWYKNNELYRFEQPVGKQYTYGHGPDGLTDKEKMDRKMIHLEMENEILKKYMEILKELSVK